VAIISFIYSCFLLEIVDMFVFIFEHRLFLGHLVVMGALSTVGQMFVYRMIKQFKQHFPPFVITTRKIFTVGLSIIYYHHETNLFQLIGLFLVFALVTYEFVSELVDERAKESEGAVDRVPMKNGTSLGVPESESDPSSRYDS
jgi:UDP-galactose transporter B1